LGDTVYPQPLRGCPHADARQKRFICEITGHSGLNFFDAQKSEAIGSQEVDSSFPEALREPVLRRVQFSTISRIDNLVDQVFEDFRQDFYPGETVTVVLDDGNRLNGLVREKAKFPELRRDDGSVERKAFSRYFVQLMTRSDEEALVDDDHIVRDRKAFTKQMLRSFIKNTVTREAWTGAPWLVKPKIAAEYLIDTRVPPHLQQGNKAAARKANAAARRGEQEGMYQFWASRGLPELKPAIKGPKSKMTAEDLAKMKHEQFQEYQRALQGHPTFMLPKQGQTTFDPPPQSPSYGTPYSPLPHLVPKSFPKPPPPPPPIKYPIEDLEVAPVRDGTHRPAMKFLSKDTAVTGINDPDAKLLMSTVGGLLETWNTLNVYCQVFLLDSFTFDDFVEAMQFSSTKVDCELFNEIHCAVLKKLVSSDNDQNGAIQISLPDLPEDEDEDEDESGAGGSSTIPTPTPEPEVPVKRTTRSSMNKAEVKPTPRSRSATADVKVHRAAEMFGEYGWIQRLRKRDFRKGGWQLIVVGLLHQVARRPRLQADCDEILTHLAPLDAAPTQQTAWMQYCTMDINMRVKVLQIICMLTLETKAIKAFLEESSGQMTELRKNKIEHQRARKEA
jgi:ATP-utilising chromatin assembly and remodelling N-terminal/DDT domain/WSTF, HB1, Itc1p, MBD9 motif 1